MIKLRVLGVGSPFSDDQLGWKVIDHLQASSSISPLLSEGSEGTLSNRMVEFIKSDRPGIRLLELMQGVDAVFIVDAIKGHGMPGQIHQLQREEILASANNLSSHAIGVAEALLLGEALGELPAILRLYGIEMTEPMNHEYCSPIIENAIEKLVASLEKDIAQISILG